MPEEKPIKETLEKIVKEFQEAGATKWVALKIIKELEMEKISDKKLKEKAIGLLNKLDPQSAEIFESFQKMKVYNSKEIVKSFDRGNIIHSLLKETTLSRTIAEKIGAEVENKLKDINLEYLNTSLIREMVAVKLLEFGQEKSHKEYTRVGLPIFEVENNLEREEHFRREVLREYTWLKIIPEKIRELHFKSIIHLCDVPEFCTKPFSSSFYFRPKTGTPAKQVIELGHSILEAKKNNSRGILAESINAALSPAIENFSTQKTAEFAELVTMQLEHCFDSGQKMQNIVSVDLFDSGKIRQTEAQKEKSIELAQQLIKCHTDAQKNMNFCLAVKIDSKYKLKLLEQNNLQGIYFINCPEENTSLFPPLIPAQTESISIFAGINLQKIASNSADYEIFGEKIAGIAQELGKLFKLKQEKLKERKKIPTETGAMSPVIGLFEMEMAAKTLGMEEHFTKFFEKTAATLSGIEEKPILAQFTDAAGVEKLNSANKSDQGKKEEFSENAQKIFLQNRFGFVHTAKNQDELERLIEKKAQAVFFEPQLKKSPD